MNQRIVKASQWKDLLYALVSFFDNQPDTYKAIYTYINKANPKQWHGAGTGIERLLSYDVIKNAWENGGDMSLAKLAAFVHYCGSKIEIGSTKMIVTPDDILEQARYIKSIYRPQNPQDTDMDKYTLSWDDLQEIVKRAAKKVIQEIRQKK